MSSPAFAIARHDAALVIQRAAAAFWTSLRTTHRDITGAVAISLVVHLIALIGIGSAIYVSGEDETDVPELSVQIETREGPNSEEFTKAALPQPAPDPVEDVLLDPGTAAQTLDATAVADSTPLLEETPDVNDLDTPEAVAQAGEVSEATGPVLATMGDASTQVAEVPEAVTKPAAMPQPEQVMLTRNVQQLAQKLLDTNMTNTELTWQQDGKQYSAHVMRQPASDSTGLEQVVAEIMTDKDGKRMKTRLSLKRLSFSHFTQLVNRWDQNIQLHDDVIDGRFHSNTEIGISTNNGIEPRFFGKVTTAAANMTYDGTYMRRRNRDVFQGGMETRTEKVALPRDMPDVVNGGTETDRRIFEEDTRVIFNPDGSYAWQAANGEGAMERVEPSRRPSYLIGAKGSKLYVRGTVAGNFTVYSPTDIEIEGNLVYLRDPRETLISHDFLALISGRDIRIAGPYVTGKGDLNIHAALYAHRRFCVESVDKTRDGRLNILGSLTAGSISETEPRYATKLDYDKRFEYLRPASFPMTRRYEVESWDPDWEEVGNPDSGAATTGLARSE
ncbi:MAG: hypothetical protein ABI821_05530 [Pseudomonadota bacterium]